MENYLVKPILKCIKKQDGLIAGWMDVKTNIAKCELQTLNGIMSVQTILSTFLYI